MSLRKTVSAEDLIKTLAVYAQKPSRPGDNVLKENANVLQELTAMGNPPSIQTLIASLGTVGAEDILSVDPTDKEEAFRELSKRGLKVHLTVHLQARIQGSCPALLRDVFAVFSPDASRYFTSSLDSPASLLHVQNHMMHSASKMKIYYQNEPVRFQLVGGMADRRSWR
ncbi:uncharacterized protein HD556DRAFT_976000 [Suillus plorans]|uniref:Uncharacterized protein n=1 Tax=Suillus plorans TaxID=116603 RepID=A0A9P7J393_9AGAM|nr:uncharacterized protein HD556DRAFT_976000 [Suillus plorans]KAG1800993.1 hypothetical protein HD556DRAFT_976000 [Suillus plorans]